MKVVFTDHAKRRMRERGLVQKEVIDHVTHPDSIEPSTKDQRRFLVKKIYFNKVHKKDRLLMVVCEQEDSALVVVTVIDTSKIGKYI